MNQPQTVSKHAVLFIRANRATADSKQHFDTQVEEQRQRGHEHAKRLDAAVVREYLDRGPARELGRRNVLLAMLGDLALRRDAQLVITQDMSRLSRNTIDLRTIRDSVAEAGARITFSSNKIPRQGETRLDADAALFDLAESYDERDRKELRNRRLRGGGRAEPEQPEDTASGH
ncbi:recombinase family protein [Flindersiella endophytica]